MDVGEDIIGEVTGIEEVVADEHDGFNNDSSLGGVVQGIVLFSFCIDDWVTVSPAGGDAELLLTPASLC